MIKKSTAFYISLFAVGITAVSLQSEAHFEKVAKNSIYRSTSLTVCSDEASDCIVIDKNEALPQIATLAPLGQEYALNRSEVYCLAQNVYHEAQAGNLDDMSAVAWGTINRVKHPEYAKTICDVVKYYRVSRYDMSWYGNLEKRSKPIPKEYIDFAKQVLLGKVANPIAGATNWCNWAIDNPNSFGCQEAIKTKNKSFKIAGTPHQFVEIIR